ISCLTIFPPRDLFSYTWSVRLHSLQTSGCVPQQHPPNLSSVSVGVPAIEDGIHKAIDIPRSLVVFKPLVSEPTERVRRRVFLQTQLVHKLVNKELLCILERNLGQVSQDGRHRSGVRGLPLHLAVSPHAKLFRALVKTLEPADIQRVG